MVGGDGDGDGGTRAYPRRNVITTNCSYTELVDLYGDPLVGRAHHTHEAGKAASR